MSVSTDSSLPEEALELFQRRWSIRILACLHRNRGARFVVLKNRLGVTSESLSRGLELLIDGGWVQKNPGYGHPLRPEYILMPVADDVAQTCAELDDLVAELGVGAAVYRKWSVPVLHAVGGGVGTFTGVRRRLAITPRALSQCLERLTKGQLIEHDGTYWASASGVRISRAADAVVSAVVESRALV